MANTTSDDKKCLNCGFLLREEESYCGKCGQKVDGNNLRLGVLIREFFENYISLDTQFGRSIKPFLFKPGILTLRFNQGKRRNFANPFRLYILVSIFFFFAINRYIKKGVLESQDAVAKQAVLMDFTDLPSDQHELLQNGLSKVIISELSDSSVSSFKESFDQLTKYRKKKVTEILDDSVQAILKIPMDSTYFDSSPTVNFGFGSDHGFGISISDINFKVLNKYRYDRSITDAQLVDSLNMGELDERERYMYEKTIRSYRSDHVATNQMILKNMSFAMFILVPLSALLLMLFFYRKATYYVEHLIHSIHIHSFTFLLFGSIYLSLSFLNSGSDTVVLIGFLLAIIIMGAYLFSSFKRVYGGSNLAISLKMIGVSFLYWMLVIIILLVDVILSVFFIL